MQVSIATVDESRHAYDSMSGVTLFEDPDGFVVTYRGRTGAIANAAPQPKCMLVLTCGGETIAVNCLDNGTNYHDGSAPVVCALRQMMSMYKLYVDALELVTAGVDAQLGSAPKSVSTLYRNWHTRRSGEVSLRAFGLVADNQLFLTPLVFVSADHQGLLRRLQ
jgi:hypothetical protein